MIDRCDVIRINDNLCTNWLLDRHYLKRIPTISDAFGLLIDSNICGICTKKRKKYKWLRKTENIM
jgi:hypothetical protein